MFLCVTLVLSVNILSSDYFKELYWLKTYHEVINVIYNQVIHVEPWMTGNCRGPSSDFCLLYKFLTMKLTVGFVYLRYVTEPKTLWVGTNPTLIKDDERE
uniref:Pre-mRNA-splicing factor 38 n=1 Tax=Oryza meridionalis TaxID=40149 RepID=A0A0E0DC32_9ORYZ